MTRLAQDDFGSKVDALARTDEVGVSCGAARDLSRQADVLTTDASGFVTQVKAS